MALQSFRFDGSSMPLTSWIAPTTAATLYLTSLLLLSQRRGDPLKLKSLEVAHNAVLIVLSFATMMGTVQGALDRAQEDGWVGLFCSPRQSYRLWDGRLGAWTYIFYLTKYYELFDTVILALKKKSLIFLHVYHHTIIVFVAWSWFAFPWIEGAWWCAFINSFIHVGMYSYYLLSSLGRRAWWKRYLTVAQMIQFMTGNAFCAVFFYKSWFHGCGGSVYTGIGSIAVNMSFLVLFGVFYRKTYESTGEKTIQKTQ